MMGLHQQQAEAWKLLEKHIKVSSSALAGQDLH
jgi:hypothetical protein